MIKAIIFDWHGVLDHTKFSGLIEKLAELAHRDTQDIEKEVKLLVGEYDREGKPEHFWSQVKSKLNLEANQVQAAQSYILNVEPNTPLWERLPALATKYRLAILSDCPEDKMKVIKQFPGLDMFEQAYFSCERGASKTDDKFFLNLLSDLNLGAADCLYVDDNQKHIETANRLGFKTCLFVTIEDFDRSLN
jgi:FMN phosphatase YigB (HAD superfamily)